MRKYFIILMVIAIGLAGWALVFPKIRVNSVLRELCSIAEVGDDQDKVRIRVQKKYPAEFTEDFGRSGQVTDSTIGVVLDGANNKEFLVLEIEFFAGKVSAISCSPSYMAL